MNNFWKGFEKRATAGLTGGKGQSGGPKNQFIGQLEPDNRQGTQSSYGDAGGEDTRTDKTLLDRVRNPRDFNILSRDQGPEFSDESIPHIKY